MPRSAAYPPQPIVSYLPDTSPVGRPLLLQDAPGTLLLSVRTFPRTFRTQARRERPAQPPLLSPLDAASTPEAAPEPSAPLNLEWISPQRLEPRLPEPPPPTHPDSFVNVPDYITLARAERLSAPLLPPPDLSAARTAAGAALEQQGGPEGRSYVAPSVPASYRRRRSLDGACF